MDQLKISRRTIDEIIIHCSATKAGQAFTVNDIRRWHKQRGFTDIGYHYVVMLNGDVVEGRDVSQIGAHCTGHNANSIGICYIGGLDSKGNPCDTRTPEQKSSLRDLVSKLKAIYSRATVHGHREFAPKACPCFDLSHL